MPERRPAALLPAAVARLVAYALLAGVASLQWARQVENASSARALVWMGAGALAGALVALSIRAPERWRGVAPWLAAALGLLIAVAASGLDLIYLKPARWEELGAGVLQGLEALNSVRLPYIGRDPWVGATVELSGALLCASAAVLAAWPRARGGHRMLSLGLLLTLAASPVVSLGVAHPVPLGLALAVLTACFFWLERVPGRPGIGFAVLGAAAMLAAIPLGSAADREQPWFDYKAFAEGLGPGDPVDFNWNHEYGPIDWPREGVELFRVRQKGERSFPLYWKADVLNDFDGRAWTHGTRTDTRGTDPADDLPADWREHRSWDAEFQVSLRRLRTENVVGAGTVLAVTGATRGVEASVIPGLWQTEGARLLRSGDSYTVHAHVPRPSAVELAASTVGLDHRRLGYLEMRVDFRPDALDRGPKGPPSPFGRRDRRPVPSADIRFTPFEDGGPPLADYTRIGLLDQDGVAALERSYYDRTWTLARRLRDRATSPYDYVLRVNAHLRDPRFRYTEVPPSPGDEAPLEAFLFDSHAGYCQQFSGAMALLLRMGGVPARVVTGFSPGGLKRSAQEWIVRDTDAHSWVEAWFDDYGWVTFDPTPPGTPARSQVAAINPPEADEDAAPTPAPDNPVARRPEGIRGEDTAAAVAPQGGDGDGGASLPWLLGAAAVVLLLAALIARALIRRRRGRGPGGLGSADRALVELERALRRSGRPTPAGMTLAQLERRLGASGEGAAYLRALRATRYGPTSSPPTRAQRAAFRRDLAAGLGYRGRLRALWALPPALRLRPIRPR